MTTFKKLDMDGADVWYCQDFFTDHKTWYELIDTSVDWQSFPVIVYGKTFPQPRDSFYMADKGFPYKYAGVDRKPEEWSVPVLEMKKILSGVVEEINPGHPELNAVLGNRYLNGYNYIGKHSDSESDLHTGSFIVSVSLGAHRDFVFTHKKTGKKISIELKPGSVLLMGGDCQKNWSHELPKRLRVKDPRINLTFRSISRRI